MKRPSKLLASTNSTPRQLRQHQLRVLGNCHGPLLADCEAIREREKHEGEPSWLPDLESLAMILCALDLAREAGRDDIVELLRKHGATK